MSLFRFSRFSTFLTMSTQVVVVALALVLAQLTSHAFSLRPDILGHRIPRGANMGGFAPILLSNADFFLLTDTDTNQNCDSLHR